MEDLDFSRLKLLSSNKISLSSDTVPAPASTSTSASDSPTVKPHFVTYRYPMVLERTEGIPIHYTWEPSSAPSSSTKSSGIQPPEKTTDESAVTSEDEPGEPEVVRIMQETEEKKELVTALDYYEEGMKLEAEGRHLDGLALYRWAYRLDPFVDKAYRAKHFPIPYPKPTTTTTSTDKAPVKGDQSKSTTPITLTTTELFDSFETATFIPAPPAIEGDRPPPCLLATLPYEILYGILLAAIEDDLATYTNLFLVSKRFAFIVHKEDHLWKHVCLSDKFGFTGMLNEFPTHRVVETADGRTRLLTLRHHESGDADLRRNPQGFSRESSAGIKLLSTMPTYAIPSYATRFQQAQLLCTALRSPPNTTTPNKIPWRTLYKTHPRLRFNGFYASASSYIRQGAPGPNERRAITVWQQVWYYRYLRFNRDGTVLFLQTPRDPKRVYHALSREHLPRIKEKDYEFLRFVQTGRWRMPDVSAPEDLREQRPNPLAPAGIPGTPMQLGDVVVEVEGPSSNLQYLLLLNVNSKAQRGPDGTLVAKTHNRMSWLGYWSVNLETGMWSVFDIEEEKALFFNRVKSWKFAEEGMVEMEGEKGDRKGDRKGDGFVLGESAVQV